MTRSSELILPYIGVPTYLRAHLQRSWDTINARVCFIGIPYDAGASNRPGARYGPRAFREASLMYAYKTQSESNITLFNAETNISFSSGHELVDMDDIIVIPGDRVATEERIKDSLAQVLAIGAFPLVVGGDHSISYPVIKAYSNDLIVLHFDAHSDYMELEYLESCAHGVVMRRVAMLPHVRKIVHIGIRGLLNSTVGLHESKAHGNDIFTSADLLSQGIDSICQHLLPTENYYISFDVDCLDPSIAPGTGTPEPGGLPFRLVSEMLSSIALRYSVVGIDFVELNPLYDPHGISALHVARLSIDFLNAWYNQNADSFHTNS